VSASSASTDTRLLAILAGRREALSEPDVTALSRRAAAHHVEGAWLRRLEVLGAPMPSAERAALEESRVARAARNLWLVHAAEGLSLALTAAGVPHRAVKGVALLAWLAHPGDRWMDDVDLLVPSTARADAVHVARALGARHHASVRHDGLLTDAARDGTSAELEDADGAPIDLHFTRRPLPPLEPRAAGALPRPAVGALAAGLSEHVLEHHVLSPRFAARHVADLRALLDAGQLDRLLEASRESRALARTLSWLAALGAPELAGVVPPRLVALEGSLDDRARAAARRACVLGRDARYLRVLVPHRRYLEAMDAPAGNGRSLFALHARRWARIGRMLVSS
jgi:hypothetical protein